MTANLDISKISIEKTCNIHLLETVNSTNTYAKNIDDYSLPNIVIANEQTNGRGRLGRSFYSPSSKGIYMTIAFESTLDIDKILLITPLCAVAVCKAFEEAIGINPQIKWVNDIYLDDKKVCGILTEMDNSCTNKIIVGIGINCFEQEFPEEIRDRATYIKNPQKKYDRNLLISAVVNHFFSLLDSFDRSFIIREYKSRSLLLGHTVLIYGTNQNALPENGGKGVKARAIDIDQNAGLLVEYLEGPMRNQRETITSGEVTIRPEPF